MRIASTCTEQVGVAGRGSNTVSASSTVPFSSDRLVAPIVTSLPQTSVVTVSV